MHSVIARSDSARFKKLGCADGRGSTTTSSMRYGRCVRRPDAIYCGEWKAQRYEIVMRDPVDRPDLGAVLIALLQTPPGFAPSDGCGRTPQPGRRGVLFLDIPLYRTHQELASLFCFLRTKGENPRAHFQRREHKQTQPARSDARQITGKLSRGEGITNLKVENSLPHSGRVGATGSRDALHNSEGANPLNPRFRHGSDLWLRFRT
jgi:hypothetical protein